MQADVVSTIFGDQIAQPIDERAFRSIDGHINDCGISIGVNDEVVFELAVASVKDKVDPGIYVVVTNLGVIRNVCPPASRILSGQVVAHSLKWIESFGARFRIGTLKSYSDRLVSLPPRKEVGLSRFEQ